MQVGKLGELSNRDNSMRAKLSENQGKLANVMNSYGEVRLDVETRVKNLDNDIAAILTPTLRQSLVLIQRMHRDMAEEIERLLQSSGETGVLAQRPVGVKTGITPAASIPIVGVSTTAAALGISAASSGSQSQGDISYSPATKSTLSSQQQPQIPQLLTPPVPMPSTGTTLSGSTSGRSQITAVHPGIPAPPVAPSIAATAPISGAPLAAASVPSAAKGTTTSTTSDVPTEVWEKALDTQIVLPGAVELALGEESFDPQEEGDVLLRKKDLLMVLKKEDEQGWWEVRLRDEYSVCPSNFLHLFPTPDSSVRGGKGLTVRDVLQHTHPFIQQEGYPLPYFQVLHSFDEIEDHTELRVSKGEAVVVLDAIVCGDESRFLPPGTPVPKPVAREANGGAIADLTLYRDAAKRTMDTKWVLVTKVRSGETGYVPLGYLVPVRNTGVVGGKSVGPMGSAVQREDVTLQRQQQRPSFPSPMPHESIFTQPGMRPAQPLQALNATSTTGDMKSAIAPQGTKAPTPAIPPPTQTYSQPIQKPMQAYTPPVPQPSQAYTPPLQKPPQAFTPPVQEQPVMERPPVQSAQRATPAPIERAAQAPEQSLRQQKTSVPSSEPPKQSRPPGPNPMLQALGGGMPGKGNANLLSSIQSFNKQKLKKTEENPPPASAPRATASASFSSGPESGQQTTTVPPRPGGLSLIDELKLRTARRQS